jgi:hypothetical protein
LVISLIIFSLLALISVLFTSTIHRDVIGLGGIAAGIILMLPSVKIHRLIFFGGRAKQANEIFPDEHLQQKILKQIEKEEPFNEEGKSNIILDSLGYSGMVIFVLSLFIVPL